MAAATTPTEKVDTPSDDGFKGFSTQDIRKGGVLGRLEIIEDMQMKYEEKVLKLEEDNGALWSELCTLKGSMLQQGKIITALTDKVTNQEEQIKELVKENEAWKVKCGDFEEINKKIDSYGEQLQASLRANIKLGKDLQLETSLTTHIEEVNKELEKYKEEIKATYAQVVKEKETIKEVCSEVKTRNDQQEAEIRQAIRKELVTNSKLVQNTADRTKSIIIFGCLEKEISSRVDRAAEEMKIIEKIVGLGEGSKENVSDFRRIGKYEKEKNRPLRVTFNGVKNMMEVLRNARKLQSDEVGKSWSIRQDLSKEDREKLKMNLIEAKRLNGDRNEEDRNSFFYKVTGTGKLVKWYIKTKQQDQ
ncbi:uncharacterized protein PF3D7_1120000-like [Procambarus clarkii]|uniref:uncharacterized protein PF3D7_1120000-like n=1 Tax=Procambarus clarkii TaxID=6728 RepID=UPI003743E0FC